jgi:hypothetical protein
MLEILLIVIAVLLAGVLGWVWTTAAYLRFISGQLNNVIDCLKKIEARKARS